MAIIKLKNITKRYGEKSVLKDFSLIVNEGDYISITGASGKGKTTILNIIGMLDEPSSATVEVCGYKNPKTYSRQTTMIRRYELSYLFQNYGLIDSETVEENMKIAMRFKKWSKKEKNNCMKNALEKMGLSGYEQRKIYTLSGGEQQRVALAKIIIKSPKVILADEPTGSLDTQNRDYVLNVLNDFNKEGKTIIVVTHDSCVASCAKRHVCL